MLERASSCLDTGFRLSFRSQRRVPRSRRLLHSAFWSHGAGDLDLPPWALSSRPQSSCKDTIDCPSSSESRPVDSALGADGVFLDFLYPPQALAFMSRVSNPTERRERRSLFRPKTSGSRGYASLTPISGADNSAIEREDKAKNADEVGKELEREVDEQADHEDEDVHDEEYDEGAYGGPEQTAPDDAIRRLGSDFDQLSEALPKPRKKHDSNDRRWVTPSEDLTKVMQTQTGQPAVRRVWGIYLALDEQTRSDVDLRRQLILWHSEQRTDAAAQRALDLFHGLNEMERNRPAYGAAIAASMHLNKVRQAIQLHREGAYAKGHESFGSDFLMQHAISERDWGLAVDISDLVQAHSKSGVDQGYRLFKRVSTEGGFPGQMLDLIQHTNQMWSDEKLRADLQALCVGLLRHCTLQMVRHKRTGKDMVPTYQLLRDVFAMAHSMNVLPSSAYEVCIVSLSQMERPSRPSQHYGLISFLYRQYSESKIFQPSKEMLHCMLRAWKTRRLQATGRKMQGVGISERDILRDWKRFHGVLDKVMVFLLMEIHSRFGEVEEVQKYANQYKTLLGSDLQDSSALWPTIYVHAIRRDPQAAARALESMKKSFGFEPNTRCWNIAIYAFERTNDLEGARTTLQKFLMTDTRPTDYSFGPVLSLCGKFGDVEGARELLDLAAQHGVRPSTLMLNGLLVAHATSGDIKSAEKALQDAVESVRDGRAHGSLTMCYNTVMTAYAFRRDSRATMRVYGLAKQNDVELDGTTYSALMLALCVLRKTNEAYTILTTIMRTQNVRPFAYHYAIIMLGYLKQNMPQEALKAHYDMRANLVRESPSTRAAYFKAKAKIEEMNIQNSDLGDPESVLPIEPYGRASTAPLTETINELLAVMRDEDKSSFQKGILPGISDTSSQGIVSAQFEYLIHLHGARHCFDAVKQLFQEWQQTTAVEGTPRDDTPIRMLEALMHVQLQAGQYNEVERYWALIQDEVVRLQKKQKTQEPQDTNKDARKRISPPTETTSTLPPDPLPIFRRLLSRPLQLYLRALSHIPTPPVSQMTTTFASLLSSGYTIDNLTWNTYITILCQVSPPRALLAFTLVERFLIADFPGWTRPRSNLRGENGYFKNRASASQGMEYTKARHLRPDQLMPHYRTFVHLAGALLRLRSMETTGSVPKRAGTQEERDVKAQVGSVREIRKRAPKTLAAVTNMPTVHDQLQRRLIRNEGFEA